MKAFRLLLLFALPLHAATFVWTRTTSPGNWSDNANWTPSGFPDASTAIAAFTHPNIPSMTVELTGNILIGEIDFDSPNSYTITGAHTLSKAGTAALDLTVFNGNHTIASAVSVDPAGEIRVEVKSGSLTLSNTITTPSLILFDEPGILILTHANTIDLINIGGNLQIQADGALGTNDAILEGTLQAGANNLTITNPIQIDGPTPTIDTQNFNLTIGELTDSGNSITLTKAGSGILTLTTTGDYSGGTVVSEGTLSFSSNDQIGSGNLSLGNATLLITDDLSTSRTVTIAESGTLSTSNAVTLSGAIQGAGSLTKAGGGTLTLQGANTYQGGTTISAGILTIDTDGRLGNASGPLSIGNAELLAAGSFSSTRAMSLTANATIDTAAHTLTFSGSIDGPGSLKKEGAGILTLTGSGSYSGGVTLSTGTLQGNASNLLGDIATSNGTTLIFNQITDGTYSGALSGGGAFTKTGSGLLALSGISDSFTGTTTVSAGNLNVNGSLANSNVIVTSGGTLSGSGGTVGPVTVNAGGTIKPGSSIGTLIIAGDLNLDPLSTTLIQVAPGGLSSLIHVTGTANLDGTATIDPSPGYYGILSTYTILTTDTPLVTQFASFSTPSHFIPVPTYLPNAVQLLLQNLTPFLDFPFSNFNTRSVGENIDAIGLSGTLFSDTDLVNALESLQGASVDAINDALDQMHPAQISAFAELQSAVGAQILSLFHRKPILGCGCRDDIHLWVQPFGNWLEEKSQGMELGFHTHTWGIASGFDLNLCDEFAIGFGGVYNDSHLDWHAHRGDGNTRGLYGAFYADCTFEKWYLGTSFLAGIDWYDITRHIQFATIDRNATSSPHALDLMGQLSSAYFFGAPACHLFPFANVDLLYLRMNSFQEEGANSLNLHVEPYGSLTLRTEAGMGLEISDKNYDETICFSPLVALGWTMNCPISRDRFTATFQEQTIPFQTIGWEETTQLFSLRFGLNLHFYCFLLSGEYVREFSTDSHTSYENQRANVRAEYQF